MRIGTHYSGKIKEFEKQYIQTEFFILGLPIYPIKSIYVTGHHNGNKLGIEFGKYNLNSAIKGMASIWSMALGFALLIGIEGIYKVIGVLLCILSVYFFFFFGKCTEDELKESKLYQNAIGIGALPKYFDRLGLMNIRNRTINILKQKNNNKNLDWLDLIKTKTYNENDIGLLFAISGYHNELNPSNENRNIHKNLKTLFSSKNK